MITEFQDKYRWLSNFAYVKINLDGIEYPSVEHAYMSAKSTNPEWKRICSNSDNSPGYIKKSSRVVTLVSNWEEIKLDVMQECIRQKFSQEPFRTQLLATGNMHLQEGNRWNDKFWGVCLKTNQGLNHLGKIIMQVREDLRKN